ncbi:uncharacterized protein LOC143632056 [Bidens hawaiensis]|uniref:uncharacterized protein LOC143632056 n=1 Tax=Bidens hawaiensis TaxID=980011 RepID=UPI00404B25FA
MSPFEALYGIPAPLHMPYIPNNTKIHSIEEWFKQREIKLPALKTNLAKAKNIMKQIADKHRSERDIKVCDWVYVKLQSYVHNSIKDHRNKKLGHKYFGPYLVLERMVHVAYKLDFPNSAHIHHTFHVSLLKAAMGPPPTVTPLPITPRLVVQPRAILDHQFVKKRF